MIINLKDLNLSTILPALRDLGNANNFMKMDMNTARNLLKTIKIIDKEIKNFEEIQNKIVETNGKRDKDNNLIQSIANGLPGVEIQNDKIKETKSKINEALDCEFEIPFEAIRYSELESKYKISSVELLEALDGIFIID